MTWLLNVVAGEYLIFGLFTLSGLVILGRHFRNNYRKPEKVRWLKEIESVPQTASTTYALNRVSELEHVGFSPVGVLSLADGIVYLRVLAAPDRRTIAVVLSGHLPTGEIRETRLSSRTLRGETLTTVSEYAVPDLSRLQRYQLAGMDSLPVMLDLHTKWIERETTGIRDVIPSRVLGEIIQARLDSIGILINKGYARLIPPDNEWYCNTSLGTFVSWVRSSIVLMAALARIFIPFASRFHLRC